VTEEASTLDLLRWKINKLKEKIGSRPNCTLAIPHCDRDVRYRLRENESRDWIYVCEHHFEQQYEGHEHLYTVEEVSDGDQE